MFTAYFSLRTKLVENHDFTADKFTVHADLVFVEMQEHNTNIKISITCLQVSKTLRTQEALIT